MDHFPLDLYSFTVLKVVRDNVFLYDATTITL